jgi:hypothetical protein
VNLSVLQQLKLEQVTVEIRLAETPQEQDRLETELDEMWSACREEGHAPLVMARQATIIMEKC